MKKFSNTNISFQEIVQQKPLRNLSDDILFTPCGKEFPQFKINDRVVMSGLGPINVSEDIYTIKEIYKQNGYFYYVLEENTGHYSFRQKELLITGVKWINNNKKNQFTWIVEAEKNERNFKPHFFKYAEEAIIFYNKYKPIMIKKYDIDCMTISSIYSLGTAKPFLRVWYK